MQLADGTNVHWHPLSASKTGSSGSLNKQVMQFNQAGGKLVGEGGF